MATESEHQEALSKLRELLRELTELDPEENLVRGAALGEASFRPGIPTFERTLNLFRELQSSDLSILPTGVIQQISTRAQTALNQFEQVQNFTLAQEQNPVAARDHLITTIENEYDKHFQVLEPHINYLLVKQTDFAAIEEQARATIQQLDAYARKEQEKQQAIRQEMEETLRSVQEAAAEAGVGQQSMVFKNQADELEQATTRWLRWTVVFGVAAFIYSVLFFVFVPFAENGSTADIVRATVQRLVTLSLLVFGLGFSARQYSALRHNEVVTRHRQSALQTFETFVRATEDRETKDAVLLEATRSIFAGQPTGYLRHESHRRDSPNTVIEVMRRISSSSE